MSEPQHPEFDGVTYDPKKDKARLRLQLQSVLNVMRSSAWRSLRELAMQTGHPEASVSARLRDLRKAKFGGHQVSRRRRGEESGTYEYQVVLNHQEPT